MSDRLTELRDVAGTVSRETLEKLEAFESAFQKWSTRINLAAPSTLGSLWQRHILDSAQLLGIKPDSRHWLDLGSGGGFPGAIVALLLSEYPGSRAELVESNNKKAAFLRTVLGSLQAPATVYVSRIEDSYSLVSTPEIVTARALAPLSRLFELAWPWLDVGAVGLFHKGRDYAAEIAETRYGWEFDLIEHRSKVDPDSRILEISGLRRRQG